MVTKFYFYFNELTFSACVNVKIFFTYFRKALGQNKGCLSVEGS